jgi:hypothetical protein
MLTDMPLRALKPAKKIYKVAVRTCIRAAMRRPPNKCGDPEPCHRQHGQGDTRRRGRF